MTVNDHNEQGKDYRSQPRWSAGKTDAVLGLLRGSPWRSCRGSSRSRRTGWPPGGMTFWLSPAGAPTCQSALGRRPMTSRRSRTHPGLACRPVWSVIPPRSGRAVPPSARAAGPSRSATLEQRQRSPSTRHRQYGAGEDHAGLGRIHPKDRNDASDRADQHRRWAAKLADRRGDENLIPRRK
jgi:hypothetical protein